MPNFFKRKIRKIAAGGALIGAILLIGLAAQGATIEELWQQILQLQTKIAQLQQQLTQLQDQVLYKGIPPGFSFEKNLKYGDRGTLDYIQKLSIAAEAEASTLISPNLNPADLNQDQKVDSQDIAILLSSWGKIDKPDKDINQDGKINGQDLLEIFSSWTCSDGTPANTCSLNKPKYCDKGVLINKSSLCGCPAGQIPQADESCLIGSADLDVTYVRRTPEYEWNASKNWPDLGEVVTFTAHIANKGGKESVSVGNVDYSWQIYNEESQLLLEQTGQITNIKKGEEARAVLNWAWQDGPKKLKFTVDPTNRIPETYENNNDLEEYTNAYLVGFRVEKSIYNLFNSQASCQNTTPQSDFVWADGTVGNGYRCGTKSWEDWAQRQIKQFNEFLRKAENDYLEGVEHSLPRLKLNRIDINEDGHMAGHHNCPYSSPENRYYDSSWGFEGGPGLPFYQQNPDFLTVERALIHEMGHTFHRGEPVAGRLENGQIKIKDESGNYVFPQTGIIYFCDKEICTDHIMLNPGSANGFSNYDALGLRYQLGYQNKTRKLPTRIGHRNGCEWPNSAPEIIKSERQIPSSNKIKIVDLNGNPIPYVQVAVYKSQPLEDWVPDVDNTPDITGSSDSQGLFDLGQYPLAPPETLWPRIGRSLVIKITQNNYIEYRFLDFLRLNIASWNGQDNAIYNADLKSNGTHRGIVNLGGMFVGTTNLALNKPTTASAGSNPEYAADGDKTTIGQSWEAPASSGSWWQVDLGENHNLYKITIYPHSGNPHDWYQKFHIEVSTAGAFSGEQSTVVTENDFDLARGSDNYISYMFNPALARYVRIVSDIDQDFVRLQEVEIFSVIFGAG